MPFAQATNVYTCSASAKTWFALNKSWCDVNRLGDSGVNRLGDTSAFVNTAGQLLLTRRSKTRMDGVGIVFEFYTAPL